ncbi:MAG: hypothetical protein OEQ29_00370 [Alphaproteobacteria bacterium]|nr:hypothetical protein [Alphaproteobacteria bacterium]
MAIGAIGGCTDCTTEALQRGTAFKAPGEPPLSPAAEANRLDDKKRDSGQDFIVDLRANPAEDAARTVARRDYEGAAGAVGRPSAGTNSLVDAAGIDQSAAARTAPDAPTRRHGVDQSYRAAEASDAKVAPRGGVFDLSV